MTQLIHRVFRLFTRVNRAQASPEFASLRRSTRFSIVVWFASIFVALAAADDEPHFVERPGIVEFSGQMIVRPMQPADLRAAGTDADEIRSIRARASTRLAQKTIEYVRQTDEFIVAVPNGETENSFAARLMATGDYQYAVPNWICHPVSTIPNDGGYWQQWHHQKVRSALAWDFETGDAAVIIAIVDGGVEVDHIDLAGALVPGYNAQDRLTQQNGGDVTDVDGHGTFVAGLAGAIGNNGTHVVGMGWDFSIMPVRYYNNPGGGFLHNLLDGVRWAADNGAQIVNVSQTGIEFAPVQTTGAYVREQGSLLFWAAGNDGRDLSWFDWNDVLIVGATDEADERPSWSAYGEALDLYAPGNNILSTGVPGVLAIGSGTSSATPIAAGIAGLVWSAYPDFSPAQVEQAVLSGCVDLGAPGNDAEWGNGRVDAWLSVSVCRVDLALPIGQIDFFDIQGFLARFAAEDPIADWNEDTMFDVFDLIAFLADFDLCY